MTLDELRAVFHQEIAYAGGLNKFCDEHHVARSHASEFLNGKRNPTTDLLDALGMEWQVVRKVMKCPA